MDIETYALCKKLVKESGGGEISGNYVEKPTIVDVAETVTTIGLANNTEYRCGTMGSITISLGARTADYESSLVFTSGATATEIIYDDNIYWSGTDVIDSDGTIVFVPVHNMRYNISLWYDGLITNAIVRGVDYDSTE